MRSSKIIATVIMALLPVVILSQSFSQTQLLRKIALVVGNGNYPSSILANPENDAKVVAASLKELGFVVYKYENLTQNQMKRAIDDFGLSLKGYDVGLFFYAGHGIQASGYNYLIPVDANLLTEKQVEYDCVQADRILALMEGSGTKINIIILDACRNNPFERAWTRSSTGRGLAFMNAPGGTLIAYSTAPGTTALDGSGNNSPYTAAFVESLKIPGISVIQMFQHVTRIVSDKTGKQQIPWISSSLTGDFFLNSSAPAETAAVNQQAVQNIAMETSFQPLAEDGKEEELPADDYMDPVENLRYKTVRIGSQVWMAQNLRATKFNDGTPIPLVPDANKWSKLTTPGYCWYDNRTQNSDTYGALYNWYAVNTGKLCPAGWHIPSDAEWTTLTDYYGGTEVAGGKLKAAGTTHWRSPNTEATNESGFTALPGGSRSDNGLFNGMTYYGDWWGADKSSTGGIWHRDMRYIKSVVYRGNIGKNYGFSVRCIRD